MIENLIDFPALPMSWADQDITRLTYLLKRKKGTKRKRINKRKGRECRKGIADGQCE